MSRRRETRGSATPSATGSPNTSGSPSGSAASTITIPGRKIAEEIVAYARPTTSPRSSSANPSRSRWFEIVHGSVVHELLRKTGPISVHVISAEAEESSPPQSVTPRRPAELFDPLAYIGSAAAVGDRSRNRPVSRTIYRSRRASRSFFSPRSSSARSPGACGRRCLRVLSVLAFNFFFIPPYYTFTITDPKTSLPCSFSR